MCTVLFIPQRDKIFFASLRDENPQRPKALLPNIQLCSNSKENVNLDAAELILSPSDALAGGTWVGVNNLGHTIILLNGGFKNHIRQSKYRHSRGMIVTNLLSTPRPIESFEQMDLHDIEPFTLVVWVNQSLNQLVWDGLDKTIQSLPIDKSYIWSSSTLYRPEVKEHRKALFDNWMKAEKNITEYALLDFFKSYTDSHNGFIMNRSEQIKTLSFTFIELDAMNNAKMQYCELENPVVSFELSAINVQSMRRLIAQS